MAYCGALQKQVRRCGPASHHILRCFSVVMRYACYDSEALEAARHRLDLKKRQPVVDVTWGLVSGARLDSVMAFSLQMEGRQQGSKSVTESSKDGFLFPRDLAAGANSTGSATEEGTTARPVTVGPDEDSALTQARLIIRDQISRGSEPPSNDRIVSPCPQTTVVSSSSLLRRREKRCGFNTWSSS